MTITDVTDIHEEFDGERLPPGQNQTERFPVLMERRGTGLGPRDVGVHRHGCRR